MKEEYNQQFNTIYEPENNHAWPIIPLGELAADEPNAMTDGPFGSNLKSEHYTEKGPRVIRLQNIGDAVFVEAEAHISDAHFLKLKKHSVFSNDIVIAALGENPPRSCIIPDWLGPAIVKADCIRFKPGKRILPKFINYVLNAPNLRKHSKAIIHGVGRPRLNLGEIKALPIPVPSLPEQQQIVAEIEKQFTRLDSGVAALKRVQVNLKRYRAAVLKAACEGRLVPTEAELAKAENRSYETGEELLGRILEERRRNWKGRKAFQPPPAYLLSSIQSLPDGWIGTTLEHLSNVVRGASPRPAGDPKFFGGEVPWITVGPLTADNSPYLKSVKTSLNDLGKEYSRYVEPQTLLLTNSGATLGVPKITLIGGCINDGVAALLDVEYPLKLYLVYFLRTQTKNLRGMNQGAAQPNLNTTIIKAIMVPLPPLAEQHRIVAEVERRLSVVEELEAVVEANLKRAARLRQSVLQKAFGGELV